MLYASPTREMMRKTWSTEQSLLTLSNNLLEFWKIGILEINWNCLTNEFENDQPNFFNTFVRNKVVYHKNCQSIYNKQKLEREKMKLEKDDDGSSSVTRRVNTKPMELKSIFCSDSVVG